MLSESSPAVIHDALHRFIGNNFSAENLLQPARNIRHWPPARLFHCPGNQTRDGLVSLGDGDLFSRVNPFQNPGEILSQISH